MDVLYVLCYDGSRVTATDSMVPVSPRSHCVVSFLLFLLHEGRTRRAWI